MIAAASGFLAVTPGMAARLLLSVGVVVTVAWAAGQLLARLGQPPVLGEIIAGVALGPSLVGAVAPSATAYLFPPDVLAGLSVIGQLGLTLFMFSVGAEIHPDQLRGEGRRSVAISFSSILAPLVLGIAVGLAMHDRFGGPIGRWPFASFLGVAMAVSALPVLVRILHETGLARTRIGALVTTCAAVDDVTAWCLLALVMAAAGSGTFAGVAVTVAWLGLFVVTMLVIVGPLTRRLGGLPFGAAVGLAFLSAWITELIGVHQIFGALLAGLVIEVRTSAGPNPNPNPNPSRDTGSVGHAMGQVTSTVMLPIFFVVAGLSVRIGRLDSAAAWGFTAVILVAAVAGKLGGSAFAARACGETWPNSLLIGALLNTRGLTEIVILTVGLQAGLITETVYTMMVIMALATTLMAPAVVRSILRRGTPAKISATQP